MRTNKLSILIVAALAFSLLGACSAPAPEPTPAPPSATAEPTQTEVPPTATYTPEPPTATSTETALPSPTSSPTASDTPTATQPPPTPSGEDAIHIYYIQKDTGGPVACGDTLVSLNTGQPRSGDVEADVATALGRLFSKTQYFGELVNPAYLSNIDVESVDFKSFEGLVDVRLKGTYVRSEDRCDDSRVRAQVWTTIRQFPGVNTVYILLNGNLLGDILATG